MKHIRMSEKINMARRSNLVLFYREVKLHLATSGGWHALNSLRPEIMTEVTAVRLLKVG